MAFAALYFIALCYLMEQALGGEILSGPVNVTVYEGETASFNCVTTTQDLPTWIINGSFYSSSSLPDRHSFWKTKLTVHDIVLSDNGRTYQCVLFNPVLLSDIGTLMVEAGPRGTTPLYTDATAATSNASTGTAATIPNRYSPPEPSSGSNDRKMIYIVIAAAAATLVIFVLLLVLICCCCCWKNRRLNAAIKEMSSSYHRMVQKRGTNDNPTLQRLLPGGNTSDSN